MIKAKRLVFRSLLVIVVLIPIGIILHDAIVYVVDEKEKETATGTQDTTGFLADYDRNIFGKYRFNRGNSIHQEIYAEVTNNDGTNHEILVSGGTIEKLMHDGERYIAYHFTEDVEADEWNGVMQTGSDEQYYAILDTQTKQTEKFADIETLSAAILERQIHFGNWFYTYAQDSSEGIRTPLLGEYSYEYLDSVHGQSILRREVPIFFGVMANVQTDGERYIAFRERIIHDTAAPWYDDPVSNALLSAPSEKRIGLYRRSFLIWFSVYYDQYVLFDTQSNTVHEFNKARELESFCNAKRILLHLVNIRKI